jgi:outer membrane protein OmpA-like peptidoglycan-associated protein
MGPHKENFLMKRQPRILAGTALGLLMASAPLGAFPLQGGNASQRTAVPLIMAQSNCAEGQSAEACAQNQAKPEQKPQEKPAKAEQAAPAAEPEQKPRKNKQEQQAEPAPAEQAAPAAEEQQPKPEKKKHKQEQQAEPAPAEQAAPAAEEPQPKPEKKKHKQEQQAEPAPAERPAPAAEEPQPKPEKKKHKQEQQAEPAPAEQAAPAAEEPQPKPEKKKHKQEQQAEPVPAEQPAPAAEEQQPKLEKKKHKQTEPASGEQVPTPTTKETPAAEPTPLAKPVPAPTDEQAPAQGEQPLDNTKKPDKKPVGDQPAPQQPATGEQPSSGEQPAAGKKPASGEQTAPTQAEKPVQGEAPADPNAAPILDSQKDAERAGKDGKGKKDGGKPGQQTGDKATAPQPVPVDQGPPPADDKAAQQEIKPEKLVPVTEEKGKRVERAPDEDVRNRRRPKGADVLKEIGDRVIIQFNNQTIVESNDGPRMNRGAKDVYYEDLPRGRTRETVVRDNGNQIVTIRNRNGDIIQRSRITPDGREYVLSYVDEQHYDDMRDWRDPGDDLPPMRLTIPRKQYILDSEGVENPDDYYTFLEQPPVEKVQRLYSIDEVKRSARVRDIARRIDLDTLNFEFGSASISDAEVQKLEGVANAMEKLLKKNPAETFLIEGHTDAVGTPNANLALSDRRAESVAEALTNAFGIPPENLSTQGYGEEYLKVNTQAPNRENRRVAIRRITSLVAPVASAK